MAKNNITVPFIYSSPELGRITCPLKGIFQTAFLVAFLILLAVILSDFIISNTNGNETTRGFLFLLLCIAIGFCIFSVVVNSLLDKYIYEHIIIEDNNLIFKSSKILSGGYGKTYQISQDSKLVWSIERKKMRYMEAHYNRLIFYDFESNNNVLIKKFIIGRGYKRSWIKFLNILANASNLKIEKEEIQASPKVPADAKGRRNFS